MTINQLHKLTEKFIELGYGRRGVCVDKSKCSHVLEPDGAVIIPVSKANIKTVDMMDDDGGIKELKSGRTAMRTFLVFEAEHGIPAIDQRLQCEVEGTQLVMRIGLGTLAFAAQHCDDNPGFKVVSIEELAKDVRYELLKEEENGSTRLTDMMDAATMAAFENGSTAFDHETKIESK